MSHLYQKIKKIILTRSIIGILLFLPNINQAQYNIYIPKSWAEKDVHIVNTQVNGGKIGIINTIAIINNYLWRAIGILCFVFLVINGIKMITDRWGETSKKALKSILRSIVGIIICILSYSAVKVIINLFG